MFEMRVSAACSAYQRLLRLSALGAILAAAWISPAAGASFSPGDRAEPEAPQPEKDVQVLVDRARDSEKAGKLEDALDLASRAAAMSRKKRDLPGVGTSEALRGELLEKLKRRADSRSAWRAAAESWKGAGDGPSEIEALSHVALLGEPDSKDESKAAWEWCLEIAATERRRPRAAAQALHDVGAAARKAKTYDAARKLLDAARSAWQRLAPGSLELADTDNERAAVEMDARDGSAKVAHELYSEALSISARVKPRSPERQRALHGLGYLAYDRDDFATAAKLYRELLALQDDTGSEPKAIGRTLSILGIAETELGDYAQAEEHQLRALATWEKLGPESQSVANELGNLGLNYLARGDVDQARTFLERSLAVEEPIAKDPRALVPRLINLGNVYNELLDIGRARELYQRALAICRERAPKSGALGNVLGNLRELEYRAGDHDAAERYGREALDFFQTRAPGSLDLSIEYIGMGNLEREAGRVASAEAYYRKALGIRQKKVPNSPWVAECYHCLAEAATDRGDLAAAQDLADRSREMYSRKVGKSGPAAENLDLLGRIALRKTELGNAEAYFRLSASEWEQSEGGDSASNTGSLGELADVLAREGKLGEAFDTALKTERIATAHLAIVAQTIPEHDGLLFEKSLARGSDLAITLAALRRDVKPEWAAQAWDAVIRSRSLVFDGVARRHRRLAASNDPEVRNLFEKVAKARGRLARLVVRGPQVDVAAFEAEVGKRKTEVDGLEQKLVEKDEAFRIERARRLAGLEEVRAALGSGDALVAFVRYERRPVKSGAKSAKPSSASPVSSYAAFVLSGVKPPALVPIGAAADVDAAARLVRRDIDAVTKAEGRSGRALERAYRKDAFALRARIFDPLLPFVGAARHVFIVPDGAINSINFATLPDAKGRYLIENPMLLQVLGTERDLIPGEKAAGSGLLAVGDPSFDRPGAPTDEILASATAGTTTQLATESGDVYRGGLPSCDDLRSLEFDPVPQSAAEVADVKSIWVQTHPKGALSVALTGASATESAVKLLGPGREVIHLATHGFALGADCTTAPTEGKLPGPAAAGMALAGANIRTHAAPDEDDGILTEEEIASLDLRGVRWVVLSGCDTGLGQVRPGEGVLGLPRAFEIAGARTVVMSLWPVADRWAREWMTAFYEAGLKGGEPAAEAVRDADLAVLRDRRAHHLDTNPFYWGGFVAVGSGS